MLCWLYFHSLYKFPAVLWSYNGRMALCFHRAYWNYSSLFYLSFEIGGIAYELFSCFSGARFGLYYGP